MSSRGKLASISMANAWYHLVATRQATAWWVQPTSLSSGNAGGSAVEIRRSYGGDTRAVRMMAAAGVA